MLNIYGRAPSTGTIITAPPTALFYSSDDWFDLAFIMLQNEMAPGILNIQALSVLFLMYHDTLCQIQEISDFKYVHMTSIIPGPGLMPPSGDPVLRLLSLPSAHT